MKPRSPQPQNRPRSASDEKKAREHPRSSPQRHSGGDHRRDAGATRVSGPLSARAAACYAIEAALDGSRFAADVIREIRSSGALAPRDAGLASEIALGTVRHVVTLEHVLTTAARYESQRVSAGVRAILLSGAYQLIWMDRVPEFAAVDESVRLATGRDRGAAGMINAILRNVARAIERRRTEYPLKSLQTEPPAESLATFIRVGWDEACEFSIPVLPLPTAGDQGLKFLAAAVGDRPKRLATLIERHGRKAALDAAWASQATPLAVWQRTPLRIGSQPFVDAVKRVAREAEFAPAKAPTAAFVPAGANVVDCEAFDTGGVFVQDPTAHAAALAVQARPNERILDLCAAPGGKTAALAIAMKDRGELIACDIDPERIERVGETVSRLGLACVDVRLISPDRNLDDLGEFDAVLVDAPCSNSGVIARRPEARMNPWAPERLKPLLRQQAAILQRAAARVRPGGRLIYSTCSIEPEENEALVSAFVRGSGAWKLGETRLTLPGWGAKASAWRDGGFFASLIRER